MSGCTLLLSHAIHVRAHFPRSNFHYGLKKGNDIFAEWLKIFSKIT